MQSESYALQREADFLNNSSLQYGQFFSDLQIKNPDQYSQVSSNVFNSKEERLLLEGRLLKAKATRKLQFQAGERISSEAYEISILHSELESRANTLEFEYNLLYDHHHALGNESVCVDQCLQKFMQINIINDSFHIWHSGTFATINNFRLGKLQTSQGDWTETNAALGQAALVISTIATKIGLEFQSYKIYPMCSYTKISKDNNKIFYNLYIDGTFSLFPKRNFNMALIGFLYCVDELGQFVMRQDPSLQLPYEIKVEDSCIQGLPVTVGNDGEVWTKALKFLLTDIKWVVAWAAKHIFTHKDIC